MKANDDDAARVPFYWIDICSKNQHTINGPDTERELEESVRRSQALLVVVDTWPRPKVYTRVWCLLELWVAVQDSTDIILGLSRAAAQKIEDYSRLSHRIDTFGDTDMHIVNRSITDLLRREIYNFTLEQAEARVPEDKRRIFEYVRQRGGFTQLEEGVALKMLQQLQDHAGYLAMAEITSRGNFRCSPRKAGAEGRG